MDRNDGRSQLGTLIGPVRQSIALIFEKQYSEAEEAGLGYRPYGGKVSGKRAAEPGFEIVRSLPNGHVAALQAMIRKLGSSERCRAALASTSACDAQGRGAAF
jgi:hypothetical protein